MGERERVIEIIREWCFDGAKTYELADRLIAANLIRGDDERSDEVRMDGDWAREQDFGAPKHRTVKVGNMDNRERMIEELAQGRKDWQKSPANTSIDALQVDRLIAANLIRGEVEPAVTVEELARMLHDTQMAPFPMPGSLTFDALTEEGLSEWMERAKALFTLLQFRSMPSGGVVDLSELDTYQLFEEDDELAWDRREVVKVIRKQGFEVKP